MVHEQDHARQWLQQLETETQRFQQEQQESRDQMVELLQKFGSEVKKVEELQCRVEQTESTPDEGKTVAVKGEDGILSQEIVHTPLKTESTTTMTAVATQSEMKISKPSQICIFSGQEPVPKEEGNYNQWEFQVRGVIATHTVREGCHRKFIMRTSQRLSQIHWIWCKLGKDSGGSHQQVWQKIHWR